MGYIRVDTVDNGQQIIDAKRVLNVNLASNGNYIDFILDFFTSTPNQPSQLRLNAVTAGSLNSDTLIQYNDAVIAAQSIFVVDLTPVTGQELQSLNYNPNP
jgi:hypothetical protein